MSLAGPVHSAGNSLYINEQPAALTSSSSTVSESISSSLFPILTGQSSHSSVEDSDTSEVADSPNPTSLMERESQFKEQQAPRPATPVKKPYLYEEPLDDGYESGVDDYIRDPIRSPGALELAGQRRLSLRKRRARELSTPGTVAALRETIYLDGLGASIPSPHAARTSVSTQRHPAGLGLGLPSSSPSVKPRAVTFQVHTRRSTLTAFQRDIVSERPHSLHEKAQEPHPELYSTSLSGSYSPPPTAPPRVIIHAFELQGLPSPMEPLPSPLIPFERPGDMVNAHDSELRPLYPPSPIAPQPHFNAQSSLVSQKIALWTKPFASPARAPENSRQRFSMASIRPWAHLGSGILRPGSRRSSNAFVSPPAPTPSSPPIVRSPRIPHNQVVLGFVPGMPRRTPFRRMATSPSMVSTNRPTLPRPGSFRYTSWRNIVHLNGHAEVISPGSPSVEPQGQLTNSNNASRQPNRRSSYAS